MEEKKHKKLITVDLAFDDVYVDLHADLTINEAIDKVHTNADDVCFALTPEKALELSKILLDTVFICQSKSKDEEES